MFSSYVEKHLRGVIPDQPDNFELRARALGAKSAFGDFEDVGLDDKDGDDVADSDEVKPGAAGVAIMIERHPKCGALPDIEPLRILVPGNLTVFAVMNFLRSRLSLLDVQTIFLLVDGAVFPSLTAALSDVARKHRNRDDGLVHFTYSSENCFG